MAVGQPCDGGPTQQLLANLTTIGQPKKSWPTQVLGNAAMVGQPNSNWPTLGGHQTPRGPTTGPELGDLVEKGGFTPPPPPSFRRVTPEDLWFATGPSKASCPGAWRNAGSPRDPVSTPRSVDTSSGSRRS